MNETPAGRIRREGYTFQGLRASSCANLREAGCDDADIESITRMSQAMVRRYLRFANQRQLAKAAVLRLERTGREPTVKSIQNCKTHLVDFKREMVGDRLMVGQRTLTPPV